jgi:glycosyltransferase involved in cell wall biosynthesis
MLIITQKVNKEDPVLGFFHDWIIEFAKHESNLTVLCLELGSHTLPSNIKVISLGKEKWYGRLRILWNFLRVLASRRHDKVFVHMNPEYIVLGGLWWRLCGARIALWYTHKSVNFKLKIATWFSHVIFSASQESFRYKTSKLKVVGHGIDSGIFYPSSDFPKEHHIVTVGRISPTKNYEPLIDAMEILVKSFPALRLSIAGGPISSSDQAYYEIIKGRVFEKKLEKNIIFLGPVSYEKVLISTALVLCL